MDEEVKERVSTLEAVLGEFIVQTNKSLRRMDEDTRILKEEMREFKEEMSDFKGEMSVFKDEMSGFKGEMSDFKEEMRQDRKAMNKRWGELANRMGTLAEDIAAPNVKTMANTLFGCQEIDSYAVRVTRRNRKDRKQITEFDVILVCGDYLFINETKSNPQAEYVLAFAEKLQHTFDFFPEYEGKTLVPIFSSLYLSEPTVNQLTEHNIYAMALSGETMELLNYQAVRDRS